MENENVPAQDSNGAEEVVLETTEEVAQEVATESVEEVKARLAKAEELANNYKIRAEKAEKKARETVPAPAPKSESMSNVDLVALIKADVAEEDIPEVERYAKFQGISIAEAVKSNVVKSLLADRREKRETANAANTGAAKRSPSKASEETLQARASKGELPESDEDLIRLIRARKGLKN